MPALSVSGRYLGPERRPYVNARVAIPRLGASADIELLVDTGADTTSIHWSDRELLTTAGGGGVPPDAPFPEEYGQRGIAGQRVRYGVEDAHLAFASVQGPTVYALVRAAIALDPIPGIPSLLGRDFLERFRLDFDMPAGRLVLTRSGG